jgi:polar amino acid transport system substrate-binding protein
MWNGRRHRDPGAPSMASRCQRVASVLLVLGVGALVVGGCGEASGGGNNALTTFQEKEVRVGIADVPPSAGLEGGKAVGVYPEVTEKVLRAVGVTQFTPVLGEFGALIPSLQSDRIDVAAGGLYITPERCRAVAFSNPIVAYGEAMIVKPGNPHGIRTYEDVAAKDLRVGLVSGSSELALAESEGVADSQVQKYATLADMLDALKAGRIDAAGYDDVTINYYLARVPQYKSLESTKSYYPYGLDGGGAALAFVKGSDEIVKRFNTELAKMLASGALKPIFSRWGVSQENVDLAAKMSTAKLCAG